MIIAQACFKSLVESFGYVWILMGYELLVLVVMFGLNREVLEFLWKMNMIMKTRLIDDMKPCLMCFNCSFYLCNLLIKFVQWFWVKIKNGIFGVFWCEFPRGNPFSGFPVSAKLVGREVQNNTRCFVCFGSLGLFPNIPKCSFCGVLINKVVGTSFTWIWNGFINFRRTLNEKLTWTCNNWMMIFLKWNDDVMTCLL